MDVSDVLLKLQEHCYYLADCNNKVGDDVLRVFRYLRVFSFCGSKNAVVMGYLLPGRQEKFYIEVET